MGGLSEEEANTIVEQAEERAEVAEAAAADARREKREQERLSEMAAEAGLKLAPMDEEGEDAEMAVTGDIETDELDTADRENNVPDEESPAHGEPAAESTEEQAESKT